MYYDTYNSETHHEGPETCCRVCFDRFLAENEVSINSSNRILLYHVNSPIMTGCALFPRPGKRLT